MLRKLLPVFLLLIAWALPAHALENVTGKVGVVYGPPVFDSQSQRYYLDVSLKNISKKDTLEFPLRLLVTSLSQSRASVYQPDGINEDKMPYYLFFQGDKKSLAPGESVGPRRIFFSGIKSGKLNFTQVVQISTTEDTINNFTAALEMGDVNFALKEMDEYAINKYGSAFNALVFDNPNFAKDFANKNLIIISDVMAKYELKVLENGMEIIYDVYLYKNSSGVWKIHKL